MSEQQFVCDLYDPLFSKPTEPWTRKNYLDHPIVDVNYRGVLTIRDTRIFFEITSAAYILAGVIPGLRYERKNSDDPYMDVFAVDISDVQIIKKAGIFSSKGIGVSMLVKEKEYRFLCKTSEECKLLYHALQDARAKVNQK